MRMKRQILISLILLSSVLTMNAQITNMSGANLLEGETFIGFLGRGNLFTGGWAQYPNILTLTYFSRDFAIGGWRKSDGLWNGASLYINSDNNYIGIGTTTPAYRLDVNGSIGIYGDDVGMAIRKNDKSWDISFSGNNLAFNETGIRTPLFIKEGGYVGIGTTDPSAQLDVKGISKSYLSDFNEDGVSIGFIGRGAYYTPSGWGGIPNALTVTYNQRDFAIGGWRKSDAAWMGAAFYINSDNSFIGIGTMNPQYRLDVLGTIRAREVKVDLNGADFVFEKDYRLMPLNELEKFVKEQKHLPEIAPAKEMEKNGTELGDLNSKLLQKMEEMTLYMIEQNKKIEALQNEIKEMKAASK